MHIESSQDYPTAISSHCDSDRTRIKLNYMQHVQLLNNAVMHRSWGDRVCIAYGIEVVAMFAKGVHLILGVTYTAKSSVTGNEILSTPESITSLCLWSNGPGGIFIMKLMHYKWSTSIMSVSSPLPWTF